jgi:hypothetical protein
VITSNKTAEIGVWIQMNFKYVYLYISSKENEWKRLYHKKRRLI